MSEARSKIGLEGSGEVWVFKGDQVPDYDTYRQLEEILYHPITRDIQLNREIELLKERVLEQPHSKIVHPPRWLPKRLWQYLPSRNIITTLGRNVIGDLIIGASTTTPNFGAVGDDDGTTLALSIGNTALGNENARLQISLNGSRTRAGTTITFSTFFPKGSGADGTDIEESGVFDAASLGNLVARGFVTPVASKTASNTVTVNHRLGW